MTGEVPNMEENGFAFPEFECSNASLKEIWDYRCRVYNRHIRQTPEGYIVTEFLPDVRWAGKYNAINCAAMHHIADGRWLKDKTVIGNYIDFWCSNPTEMRRYSFPAAYSALQYALVSGDKEILRRNYQKLKENYEEWCSSKLDKSGLFWQLCDRDGMEYAISGDGLRPTINSYMYADAVGLAQIAELCGDEENASVFWADAERLKCLINEKLWNKELGFYTTAYPEGGCADVRELVGYIPFIFGIPPENRCFVFGELWEADGFYGAFGPTTAERRHKDFRKPFAHECLWNGPSWPFATSQVLTAMINLLHRGYCDENINVEKLVRLVEIYAASQHDTDGTPYIDEDLDADTGEWIARRELRALNKTDRGMDYNHSSYMDIIIRGICAVEPEDSGFAFLPELCGLDSFSLTGLVICGNAVDIKYSKTNGADIYINQVHEAAGVKEHYYKEW